MEQRENAIRLWFDMWLKKTDMGISELFAPDAVYTESWGPEYHGAEKIKLWFQDCITRQDVLVWDIKGFFHGGDRTAVQWYFQFRYAGEGPRAFEGISLVTWTPHGTIAALQEFGCSQRRYDPHKNGPTPEFEETQPMWS